ncbi:MAG: FAD-dependent oxidoreductase [Candidatus Micrarchaeota archaeon]|nr:FAD-dependent oxidoreductase [Candidatus Micrarchaeota archaeon]
MIEYKKYILKNKIRETEDVYTLEFETAGFEVPFYKAGQFFMIKIDQSQLKPNFRPYSALLPYQKERISFGIKKHAQFSAALIDLQIGQSINIAGPYGEFLFDEKEDCSVFLAGGIGITPFVCMLKELEQKNYQKMVYLFYSNKTEKDIAYKNLLDLIEKKNKFLKIIYTLSQEQKENFENGRINIEMIKKYNKNWKDSKYYLCGGKEFVAQLSELLIKNEIKQEKIKTEKW